MNVSKFTGIIKKYKKCPNCGSSYKDTDLQMSLENEIVTITCKCGFLKKVNENNKEVFTDDLIISTMTLPTGNTGYCLCNKEKTLRFTCYTMFKDDLKGLDTFADGIPMTEDSYVLV